MKLYKLTDAAGWTRRGMCNGLLWAEGVTHTVSVTGTTLCSDQVIHAYEHPLVAIFMNPIHADFTTDMRLGECEGEVVVREGQLKCGVKSLTVLRELTAPAMTIDQRVEVAVRITKQVCNDADWNAWADKWLSGEDRSEAAAMAAARDAAAVGGLRRWRAAAVAAAVAAARAAAARQRWVSMAMAAEAARAAAARDLITTLEVVLLPPKPLDS